MPLNSFAVWNDVFAPAELDAIAQAGDRMIRQSATITTGSKSDPALRVTSVAWFAPGPEHGALFAKIGATVQRLNAQFFRFDVSELEPMQYAVYNGVEGGHYGWHVDCGPSNVKPRKLSLSIQLSDPGDYEGCDLQFRFGPGIETAPRARGAVIAFPSFYLHRVTPVASGTRKALVVWANGPDFR